MASFRHGGASQGGFIATGHFSTRMPNMTPSPDFFFFTARHHAYRRHCLSSEDIDIFQHDYFFQKSAIRREGIITTTFHSSFSARFHVTQIEKNGMTKCQ